MHFAEAFVPDVPTISSQILFHHQNVFPSYSPSLQKDAHNKEAPSTNYPERIEVIVVSRFSCALASKLIVALDAAPKLYTVLYTSFVVEPCFFFSWRPSIDFGDHMFLTAFAVKLLSLRNDIRFRASCTDADDGSETDVIRALCLGTMQAKSASRATDPRSVLVCSLPLFQGMLSSTTFRPQATARIPTIVCKRSYPIQICGVGTFCQGLVDSWPQRSPFATESAVLPIEPHIDRMEDVLRTFS